MIDLGTILFGIIAILFYFYIDIKYNKTSEEEEYYRLHKNKKQS